MSSEANGHSTYHWTTLRYLVNPQREITVPIGVILWSEEQQRLSFRLPQQDERLPTVSGCDEVPVAQPRAHLAITRAKLEGWLRLGELSYQTVLNQPPSEGWWEAVDHLKSQTDKALGLDGAVLGLQQPAPDRGTVAHAPPTTSGGRMGPSLFPYKRCRLSSGRW